MNNKSGWLIIVLAILLSLSLLRRSQNSQPPITPMVQTSIDDDPMMGAINAPVTIIEFSDYECPYCKRFANDTLPQLKSMYIDMGKVRLIYRDLPLLTHEPAATNEARAANCARAQKGDVAYFRFHDGIFRTTQSGGSGLSLDQLKEIGKLISLDEQKFIDCYMSERFKDEVKADFEAAKQLGAKATPSFVVGKTTASGEIEGFFIEGAASFPIIQAIIDPLLKQ
ncbi:MAG: DSBA oxidoreductase [Candidatus Beckwithbacteria bacterium GW2011_GWA2_43_10]|uniref:DSBA oxidoreductase n=1 Tax=Candidatus Beckwithbacteria bacterium GW2011_GWA2_43_10 TaxID=1618369 RepID=A0A0G1C327_9BACT|nr:MAG: DSBA oxidoreductase [Candidatus Beckwithbacteria bacterium GW2011_GWA2_43_10]